MEERKPDRICRDKMIKHKLSGQVKRLILGQKAKLSYMLFTSDSSKGRSKSAFKRHSETL